MDELPYPDWDLFDSRHRVRPFEGELKNYGFFEMSRGCPHNCSYCINKKLHEIYSESGINSSRFRFHSPVEIVTRMKKYKERYHFNHVQFVDENLSVMPMQVLEKLAILYKNEVGVGFFAMARPEGFYSQPRKARLLSEMGCKMIALGAESGNEELKRTVLNRPMKNETLERAADYIRKAGILVSLYNIIGFPNETSEMIFDTIELNRRIRPDRFSVRFLVPYPGTAIRKYCTEKLYISQDFDDRGKEVSFLIEPALNLPSPPHPSKEQLMRLKQDFSKLVYMPEPEYKKYKREFLRN